MLKYILSLIHFMKVGLNTKSPCKNPAYRFKFNISKDSLLSFLPIGSIDFEHQPSQPEGYHYPWGRSSRCHLETTWSRQKSFGDLWNGIYRDCPSSSSFPIWRPQNRNLWNFHEIKKDIISPLPDKTSTTFPTAYKPMFWGSRNLLELVGILYVRPNRKRKNPRWWPLNFNRM